MRYETNFWRSFSIEQQVCAKRGERNKQKRPQGAAFRLISMRYFLPSEVGLARPKPPVPKPRQVRSVVGRRYVIGEKDLLARGYTQRQLNQLKRK